MTDGAGAATGGRTDRMRADVWAGLSKDPKELRPVYFYDARGSRLFDEITRLPEYYLTRTERALLEAWSPHWVANVRPRSFVELGAGTSEKSRIVLDAMAAQGDGRLYVPLDVDGSTLEETARRLRAEYSGLEVRPIVADITTDLGLPRSLPRPTLFAFLGSTIGNFARARAVQLLRRVGAAMEACDRFLMGVDLKKDVARLEAAYNDAQGVTAQFNRNILRVLNRALGADFDLSAFEHRAFYAPEASRIEMHLVSARDQSVTIPGMGVIEFRKAESIRTEISCKYDREAVTDLFSNSELQIEEWKTDSESLFALVLGSRSPD